MTQPTLDAVNALPVAEEALEAEPLNAEAADTAPDDEADDEADESLPRSETNKSGVRRTTVKLPDEPYDFTQCVITVTLGFLPCNGDPADRRAIATITSHDEAPTKVLPLRLAQLQPLPGWLQELFDAHIAALPALEAAAQARQAEEAKRQAERQVRSTRTTARANAGKSPKGTLAKLGEIQDVLFDGGEPLTVPAPAGAAPSPAPTPAPVQASPAPAGSPPPKPAPAPVPVTPSEPAAPLARGTAVPAPAKKQPALQDEVEAVQDVLFG